MTISSLPVGLARFRALTPERDPRTRPDSVLLLATLSLLACGLAMVYSSSAVLASARGNAGTFFLGKQLLLGVVGVVALLYLSRVYYGSLR